MRSVRRPAPACAGLRRRAEAGRFLVAIPFFVASASASG
jgi:hypothetical protein